MREDAAVFMLVALSIVAFGVLRDSPDGAQLESDYVACEKPDGSATWRNEKRTYNDRWGAISTEYYRVSFSEQRVVLSGLSPKNLGDCSVFDKGNWDCDDGRYVARDSEITQCYSLTNPVCTTSLNWISHPLVYAMGADWMCRQQSYRLDSVYEAEMRRRASPHE